MRWCKKDITPLLTHWSYVFLPLTHLHNLSTNIPPNKHTTWLFITQLPWYCAKQSVDMQQWEILLTNGMAIEHIESSSEACQDGRMRLSLWLYYHCINSSAPGRPECDSKKLISNLVLLIGIFRSSHDNALRWMQQDLSDDESTLAQVMACCLTTLVQVMTWCCQATSHYLSQISTQFLVALWRH